MLFSKRSLQLAVAVPAVALVAVGGWMLFPHSADGTAQANERLRTRLVSPDLASRDAESLELAVGPPNENVEFVYELTNVTGKPIEDLRAVLF